jgi:hypothetical protein
MLIEMDMNGRIINEMTIGQIVGAWSIGVLLGKQAARNDAANTPCKVHCSVHASLINSARCYVTRKRQNGHPFVQLPLSAKRDPACMYR